MGVCKVEQQLFVSVTVFAPEMCRSATQSLCEALGDYAHCKVGLDKWKWKSIKCWHASITLYVLCPHRHVWMKTGTVLQRYQPGNQGVLGLLCS